MKSYEFYLSDKKTIITSATEYEDKISSIRDAAKWFKNQFTTKFYGKIFVTVRDESMSDLISTHWITC